MIRDPGRRVSAARLRRSPCAIRSEAYEGQAAPGRFRTIQVYPKDLRALPVHP